MAAAVQVLLLAARVATQHLAAKQQEAHKKEQQQLLSCLRLTLVLYKSPLRMCKAGCMCSNTRSRRGGQWVVVSPCWRIDHDHDTSAIKLCMLLRKSGEKPLFCFAANASKWGLSFDKAPSGQRERHRLGVFARAPLSIYCVEGPFLLPYLGLISELYCSLSTGEYSTHARAATNRAVNHTQYQFTSHQHIAGEERENEMGILRLLSLLLLVACALAQHRHSDTHADLRLLESSPITSPVAAAGYGYGHHPRNTCSCADPQPLPLELSSAARQAQAEAPPQQPPATMQSKYKDSEGCHHLPTSSPGGECGASIAICPEVRCTV